MTPPRPGAIAIIQLHGDITTILNRVTRTDDTWPVDSTRLRGVYDQSGEIDDALIAIINASTAQIMPHGGPRVLQRLQQALRDAGAILADDAFPQYPEAADEYESLMLEALARSHSPLAIDLLLAQPPRWRDDPSLPTATDLARSQRLNHLIDPPLVTVVGPANVGKSTLSNRLLGRSMSIELDQPGTTRDYTAGLIDLGGLVVRWHDTPGLRDTDDAIEREAIGLAQRLIDASDFVIAMTDREHDWPRLRRDADVRVGSKRDLGTRQDADLDISAIAGEGMTELVAAIRDAIVSPADRTHTGRWVFDDRLATVHAR